MSDDMQGFCPNCGREVNGSGYCSRCYAAYQTKYYAPHIAQRLNDANPGMSGLRMTGVVVGAICAPVVLPALVIYNLFKKKNKK